MSRDYVIGVDCSTTAAKAVVWSSDGAALSEARSAFDLSQPRPGWGEQNAEDWWSATAAAVRRAVQTVDASRLAGPPPEGSVSWVDLSGAGQHARLDYCFVSASLAARVSDAWIDADADGSDHQPVWTVLE